MSIILKGIDMPKSCGGCEFNYCLEGGSYEWWECVILHDDINQFDTRRTDCPLIEIDLVRCGECKYMRKYALRSDEPTGIWCHRWSVPRLVTDDDFCSYGERRADEHTDKRD